MNTTRMSIADNLYIVWTIASKDILDALKNRLVITLIVVTGLVLLLPKLLPLIFEQPATTLPVYDPGRSRLVTDLRKDPRFSVQNVSTLQEMNDIICNSVFPVIGLAVPAEIDLLLAAGEQLQLTGYACWDHRFQVGALGSQLQEQLSQSLGQPVRIDVDSHIVYPPANSGLSLGLVTLNSVIMLLIIGIFLVPHLLFEEKQTKTMDALLVSPAGIGQVVAGKALAGFFYVLVAAGVAFAINWVQVTHWGVAILFILSGGTFAVAVGLVLGSFFKTQQDIVGWMMVILLVLISAMFVKMIGLEISPFVQVLLAWVPSVALAEMVSLSFSESVTLVQVGLSLGVVLLVSLPLYGLVIWKVRRSDR
jgi:ABC-type Na+ efflux pump permease subunit